MSAAKKKKSAKPRPPLVMLRSHGDSEADNLLVHGDNLEALEAVHAHGVRFRCAYLDPPYNTGRAFEQYDDSLGDHRWIAMMHPRLEVVHLLLEDDGMIAVEIDDTQLSSLLVLLDGVFGAENRISIVTVVRSASTGHKAKNRGPVHVSDFLLLYAKDRKAWRYRAQHRARTGFDDAYSTWLENPDDPPARYRFRPLRSVVARTLGHASTREASRALGKEAMDRAVAEHALRHPRHVVRFAQPRYEAISKKAQRLVDRSKARPDEVFVLERAPLPRLVLRGGNRMLSLASKVREVNGRPAIVEPITNVWDDVPFQGIAREGGVVFTRNKKPEKLVARVVAMATDPGDWVLDPFLGSGTTAAVAHKLGRRWVGIEAGDHALTLAEPRLARVVSGEDTTGIAYDRGDAPNGFHVARVELPPNGAPR